MILRFHSIEAAALFAANRRNEGYFAKLCDESVATLWGSSAVGGVRVITSEEVLEEEMPAQPAPGRFVRFLQACSRAVFWSAVLLTILYLLLTIFADPLGAFILALAVLLVVAVFIFMATLIAIGSHKLLAAIGKPKPILASFFFWLLAILLCLLLSTVSLY